MNKDVVFITGATGFLGSHLISELVKDENIFIKVLVRKTSDTAGIDKYRVDKIIGDLIDQKTYLGELKNVDTIYHIAGAVTDWAPKKIYYDTHIKGTQELFNAAISCNVPRIIHISTIDVLKKEKFKENYLLDNSPYTTSKEFYSFTKKEAECEALILSNKNRINTTIIRPSWIYGRGDYKLFFEVAKNISTGNMVFIHNKNNYLPLVHVDNLVNLLIEIRKRKDLQSRCFNISDGEITWGQLADYISDKLGKKRTKLTIPYNIAYFIALIFEIIGRLKNQKSRPLLTRTAVEMLGISLHVNTSIATKILGYKQLISLEDGISDTLNWIYKAIIKNKNI